MKTNLIFILLLLCAVQAYPSDTYLANIYGRETRSLNGKWDAIVDLYEQGATSKIFLNKKATGHSDFYEYSFENGLRLNVPGDWNSQKQELKYYEGTVWYARHFNSEKETGKRKFLYFCGVSYRCNIYLNGRKIGNHATGKKVILVLANGRPLVLGSAVEQSNAILEMWQPGTDGASAVAGILSGRINPSGKLAMTFPYSQGQIPIYYNRRSSARPTQGFYKDMVSEPLYPFGYGLSYTRYSYGELSASKTVLHKGEKVSVSVPVANDGDMPV